MTKVSDLLDEKGRDVWAIEPGAPVFDAVKLMRDKGIGAVLVMEGEQIVGIMSERDYARKVVLEERSSKTTQVREIMTPRVIFADPDQSVQECMALMTNKRIRHLPIMDGDHVVGVVSIGDLVRATIALQRFHIEQLERYIRGR